MKWKGGHSTAIRGLKRKLWTGFPIHNSPQAQPTVYHPAKLLELGTVRIAGTHHNPNTSQLTIHTPLVPVVRVIVVDGGESRERAIE
jgi:hypothetical protein